MKFRKSLRTCGIDCLAWQEKFFVNNPLTSKKMMNMLLTLLITFPLGGLLLCLRVITINPALVASDIPGQERCVVGGNLTKLLIDADMLLLLISCQKLHQARYTTTNKTT
jgi:hypothetical protein